MPTTSSNRDGVAETAATGPEERPGGSGARRARWLLAIAAVAFVALASLLFWGTFRTGGRSGGLFVNSNFGEVRVKTGPAPEFSFETFDGDELSLSGLRGKVVMVDFWASWCPPCRREAPVLAAVYREYDPEAVEFVGVDIWDDEKDARAYLERYGVTYPNGLDVGGVIAIDFGVTGIPEKYLIDRDGQVQRKFVGPVDAATLRGLLDELLADTGTATGKSG